MPGRSPRRVRHQVADDGQDAEGDPPDPGERRAPSHTALRSAGSVREAARRIRDPAADRPGGCPKSRARVCRHWLR
mgnify:CR=1 FL=1